MIRLSKQIGERKERIRQAIAIYEEEVIRYNTLKASNPDKRFRRPDASTLERVMAELSVSERTAKEYVKVARTVHKS